MSQRLETDSLGRVLVPREVYWGAQTQRSLENFSVGEERMPLEVIHALVLVKMAVARVNAQFALLSKEKAAMIEEVCQEILAGDFEDQFPLRVWQTGSGTHTNMNVNEVISNRAVEKVGGTRGSKNPIHPNDDVNKSHSTNDAFPTAMHLATLKLLQERLLPQLGLLRDTLAAKAVAWKDVLKIGRTHLMDATPLTLGQEFSGYASQLDHCVKAVENTFPRLAEIAMGGTVVGTGMNAPPAFGKRVAEVLSELTGVRFISAPNKFEALASHETLVEVSGALKQTACCLTKIANDIRWMASGPHCGLGELRLPDNEPGSSIMPGKVNPTQCEAVLMVCAQVMGNDVTISLAASQGNFELNVFKTVLIYNLLQSLRLLADVVEKFHEKCVKGMEPNKERLEEYARRSLMLVTALNHEIGYDKAYQVVAKATAEGISLKSAAVSLGFVSPERFDVLVDPRKMV